MAVLVFKKPKFWKVKVSENGIFLFIRKSEESKILIEEKNKSTVFFLIRGNFKNQWDYFNHGNTIINEKINLR